MNNFYYFIINKKSRKVEETFKKLLLEVPKYTNQYKVHITEDVHQLEELTAQLKDQLTEKDIVVCIGGDGSLNQTVTFFEKNQIDNPIGYIPAGSGNDFARSHDIPFETKAAVAHLFTIREPQKLSIIEASQGDIKHYAVNSLGLGLDGQLIYNLNSSNYKRNLGPLSYISQLFSSFKNQDKFPLTLRVDQGTFHYDHAQIALIANNPYLGGGIKALPDADGKDDVLDILIADNVGGKDFFPIVYKLLTSKTHLEHPKLHHFKSKSVALYTESHQYAQKDGESFHQDGYAYIFKTFQRSFWI